MSCQVIFQPAGRRGTVASGKNLLEAARELGVDIESPCGGAGVCGKCRVKIEAGFFPKFGIMSGLEHLSPVTEEEKQVLSKEELANNYRLACLTKITGSVLVFVPEESRGAKQVVLETGTQRSITVDPAVRKYQLKLASRSLGDPRGDWEFLRETLVREHQLSPGITPDYSVLRKIPVALREKDGEVTVWVWQDQEVIAVESGFREELYGVAIDVGTTTVAAYLCNLETGEVAATKSLMNPQVRYGEDVLSRITYTNTNPQGLANLNQAIIEGINQAISALTGEIGLLPHQVADLTLVFNTAMHHIALNLEPQFLGHAPFLPAVKEALDLKAKDLGINISPGAWVHVLPVEAGFVGPDNMAVIIAEEPYNSPGVKLIIDIGTNGEIVLGDKTFLASTSCATGPALEGAQITFGMRAAEGAIERVRIDPETLSKLIAGLVLLNLWELLTLKFNVFPLPYFPSISKVVSVLFSDWKLLGISTLYSLRLLALGYGIGVLVGIPTGIAMGWYQRANYWLNPILRVIGPIPSTAWIPIAMVIFPTSFAASVFLIALGTWFPVTVMTWSGIANVNKSYFEVARTLGGSEWYLIRKVALPAALPLIFIGLFMGMGVSFVTLVVGEMLGVKAGLGWYIQWAQGWAEYAKVYASLLVMALLFSSIITLVFRLRDRVLVWQKGLIKW